jgi:tetratricopeptide (TPR) repeat protein
MKHPLIIFEKSMLCPEPVFFSPESSQEEIFRHLLQSQEPFLAAMAIPEDLEEGPFSRLCNLAVVEDFHNSKETGSVYIIRPIEPYFITEVLEYDGGKISLKATAEPLEDNIVPGEENINIVLKSIRLFSSQAYENVEKLEKDKYFYNRALLELLAHVDEIDKDLYKFRMLYALEEADKLEVITDAAYDGDLGKRFQLGISFFKYSHYERAISVFKLLLEEEELDYTNEVIYYIIKSHYILHQFEEALSYYIQYEGELQDAPELTQIAGECYSRLGYNKEASLMLESYEKHLPHVNESIYSRETKIKKYNSFVKIIKDLQTNGISAYVAVHSILPVLLSGRRITSCSFRELLVIPETEEDTKEIMNNIAEYLWINYGVISKEFYSYISVKGDPVMEAKVFFYKDPALTSVLEEFRIIAYNILKEEGMEKASEFVFREEGKMLGYPECCIEAARYDKLQKELSAFMIYDFEMNENIADQRYFAYEFMPCSIDCTNALQAGIQIYDKFMQNDPEFAELFKDELTNANWNKIVEWEDFDAFEHQERIMEILAEYLGIKIFSQEQVIKKNIEKLNK